MALSDKDLEKIELMQQLRKGEIDTLPDVDSDKFKLSKIRDMMSKAEGVDEVTSRVGSRISGMIHRPFLVNFLEKFAEIYQDLIDNGEEFDPQDVIDFLSIEMSVFANDRGLDASLPTNEASRPGYHADGTPKSNDEMTDDEREDFYNDLDDVNEETLDEGVVWLKRFSGIK